MTATTQPEPQRLAGQYLASKQGGERLRTAVTLAAATLDFPDGQINVLDAQQQHTISGPRLLQPHSIPRSESICQFVVDSAAPLALDDVRTDSRVAALPSVAAGLVGSYLGMPLVTREPQPAGTLCVVDPQPRTITPGQVNRLGHFVDIVSGHLDLMRVRTQHDLDRLAAAVDNDEIQPHYEPIIDLSSGGVVAYEAKARWQQPSGKIIDPTGFLPVAGDRDLALELDRVVMRRAFVDVVRARRTSPQLRVSVNVSNRHLDTADGVREICYAAIDAGLPPSAIDLEIVETEDFVDEQMARNAIGALRQYGFGVVLDDFGSGWSSLEWVLRLPVSGIKVNRSVAAAVGTPIGNSLARAVAGLASEARLVVGIDGIEGVEQAELVRTLGYRQAQGAHWSANHPAAVEPGLAC